VRVIATTNKDLQNAIGKKEFREDLYYRLNVVPIRMPALRERKDDIVLLVNHFLKKYTVYDNKKLPELSKGAMDIFMKYPWPGNVRELENIIERIVVLELSDKELERHLESVLVAGEAARTVLPSERPISELEKDYILKTLDATGSNKTRAAEMLGISVRTLRNKLNEYGNKRIGKREFFSLFSRKNAKWAEGA